VVKTERYDFKGNLVEMSRTLAADYEDLLDWSGSVTLESETFEQAWAYDALDRPTSVTLPDGTVTEPGYDVAGLLQSVVAYVRGDTSPTTFVDSIAYDEKGRRTRIVYADEGFSTEYTYDQLSFRLKRIETVRNSDDAVLQRLDYYLDPVGNITHVADGADHDVYFSATSVASADGDYTYDAVYRLIEAEGREHATGSDVQRDEQGLPVHNIPHPNDPSGLRRYVRSYVYDVVGNLLSMAHAPDDIVGGWTRTYKYKASDSDPEPPPDNRLRKTTHGSLGDRSYTYDAHGNMATMPHLAAIDWDFADQMKHVEVTSGQDVHFVYDASGNRVRKVWRHGQYRDETLYLGGFEVWRRYVSNGGNWDLEDERETVHVADDARRICMIETETVSGGSPASSPTPRYRFQLDDHLGTVAVEVDATGNVISYEQYHPYGTSAYRAQDGSLGVSAKRYRYNGKERDDETKLYYYGARYYAPWLGRWTAADPLAFADGVGAYTYVRGSPVVLSDPNGKETPKLQKMKPRLIVPRAVTPNASMGPDGGMSVDSTPYEYDDPETGMSVDPSGTMSLDPSISGGQTQHPIIQKPPEYSDGSGGAPPSYAPVESFHQGGAPTVREPIEGSDPGQAEEDPSRSASWESLGKALLEATGIASDITGPLKSFARALLWDSIIMDPRSEEAIRQHELQEQAEGNAAEEEGLPDQIPAITPLRGPFAPRAGSPWKSAREQYYQKLAEQETRSPSGWFSQRNIAEMASGRAPKFRVEMRHRKTGELATRDLSLELHHRAIPQRAGTPKAHEGWNLELVNRWAHEAMDPYRHAGWDLVKVIAGPNSW
jgi:RHS repeat-associated protein